MYRTWRETHRGRLLASFLFHRLVFSFYQSHDSVTVHHYSKAKNSKKRKHQLSEEEIKANLRKTVCEHFYFITGTLSGTVNI